MVNKYKLIIFIVVVSCLLNMIMACTFYKFSSANIPPEIKTIYIEQFDYAREAVDLNLPPSFRNEFSSLTANRTKLIIVDNIEEADWVVKGQIDNYRMELSGVNNSSLSTANPSIQGTQAKLIVKMSATLIDTKTQEEKQFTISDETAADGDKTLIEIQDEERDNIVQRMSQSLFNQIYSNW